MHTRSAQLAGAALAAAVAGTTPVLADDRASGKPTVAIVEVATPWYAPAFIVRSKMRDTIPMYAALPGLSFKYFSISADDDFGGIYLWRTAAAAHAWFNEAWFATVLKTRGAPAKVRFYEVIDVQDMTPGGVGRDDHSDAAATLATASSGSATAWGDADPAPGLLRRYDVRSAEGRLARIDLWSNSRSAREHYDASRLARLRARLGDVRVEHFATPILLPSSLPENRVAGPS